MKKILSNTMLVTLMLSAHALCFSQSKIEDAKPNSLLKMDVGALGIWLNYEYVLSPKYSLLSEIGYDMTIYGSYLS